MTTEQAGLAAAGVVAITALVLALLAHRRARRADAIARSLAERLAVLESPVAGAPRATDEATTSTYVITGDGTVDLPLDGYGFRWLRLRPAGDLAIP